MASGHVNRTKRPNTWLHRPVCAREESPCQLGANGMDPALPAGSNVRRELQRGRIIMQVVRIGLDLAKYVFQVHGVDEHGNVVMRKTLRRGSMSTFFANLPCLAARG